MVFVYGNDPQEAQVSAGTFRTLPDSFRVGLSHGPFWIVLAHKSLATFGSELRESFGGLAQRITSSLLSLGVPSHILYREPPIMYTYIYIYMKPTQNYQTNFLCHVFCFAHPHTVCFLCASVVLGKYFDKKSRLSPGSFSAERIPWTERSRSESEAWRTGASP